MTPAERHARALLSFVQTELTLGGFERFVAQDADEPEQFMRTRLPVDHDVEVLPNGRGGFIRSRDPALWRIKAAVAAAAAKIYGAQIWTGLVCAAGHRSWPHGGSDGRVYSTAGEPTLVSEFQRNLDERVRFWREAPPIEVSIRIPDRSNFGPPSLTYSRVRKREECLAMVVLRAVIAELLTAKDWHGLARLGIFAVAMVSRRMQWEQHGTEDEDALLGVLRSELLGDELLSQLQGHEVVLKMREATSFDLKRVMQNALVSERGRKGEVRVRIDLEAVRHKLDSAELELGATRLRKLQELVSALAMRMRLNYGATGRLNFLEQVIHAPERAGALEADAQLPPREAFWAGTTPDELSDRMAGCAEAVIIDVKDFQFNHTPETIQKTSEMTAKNAAGQEVFRALSHPRVVSWFDDPSQVERWEKARRAPFEGAARCAPDWAEGPADENFLGVLSGRGAGADQNYAIGGAIGGTIAGEISDTWVGDAGDNVVIFCGSTGAAREVRNLLRDNPYLGGYPITPAEATFRGYLLNPGAARLGEALTPREALDRLLAAAFDTTPCEVEPDALRGVRKLLIPERGLKSQSRRNWGLGIASNIAFYSASGRGAALYRALSDAYLTETGAQLGQVLLDGPGWSQGAAMITSADLSPEERIAFARYIDDPDRIHFDPAVMRLPPQLLDYESFAIQFAEYGPLRTSLRS